MDLYTLAMKTTAKHIFVECSDLDAAIAMYTQQFAMRLDMIMPADAPRIAVLSGEDICLRIEANMRPAQTLASTTTTDRINSLSIVRCSDQNNWIAGRAGMQYRDLIPGRLGGRFIASHIRIADAGPVPDYVHYHKVAFQIIYCRRGWVRVVYEDQGPPFVMHAGDCVLQPPTIRHRVLESSAGLEVIEIGGPAEHETWREHEFDLPTPKLQLEREFGGQQFVHHIAAKAQWQSFADSNFEYRDTEIATASNGVGSVRVFRPGSTSGFAEAGSATQINSGDLLFLYVLDGELQLHSEQLGEHTLCVDDACVIPSGTDYRISASAACEVLEVALPAR